MNDSLANITKSTEPHEISNKFVSTNHPIRSEDDLISLSIAAQSLCDVQSAIKTGKLEPEELLDLSAEALDDAALSIKSAKNRSKSSLEEDDIDYLFETVRNLASEVLAARRPLLAISCGVDSTQADDDDAAAANAPQSSLSFSSNYLDKIEFPLVVWASETGNSMRLAFGLSDRLRSVCGKVECVSMNQISLNKFARHKRVYIVCSTFGVGRPPRGAEKFYNALRCSRNEGILDGMEFAVASLGNSTFEFFAIFGQMLSHEIRAKGAEEIIPVTLFDRHKGRRKHKKQFASWEKVVVSEFQEYFNNKTEPTGMINNANAKKKEKLIHRRFVLPRLLRGYYK